MQMCGPYAADYDGNEMTLFPVYDELAMAECSAFRWDYQSVTAEFVSGCNELCMTASMSGDTVASVQAVAIATTTCWSDVSRVSGLVF